MPQESDKRLTPADLRQRTGLTQVHFAISIGKSPSTIAKWEAGSSLPRGTPSEIKRMCEAYKCTLDELITEGKDRVCFQSKFRNYCRYLTALLRNLSKRLGRSESLRSLEGGG